MSTKKNNKRGQSDHSVAGILCIVISSFFLICLTPLLSDIGTIVKNLVTGLIGYLSYPIALCTLFYGILLLMNKKATISGKQITFIFLIAAFAVLILQTALDAGKMSGSFGEYLSSLISFDKNNTTAGHSVGGVIFGIFVFGIKSILSSIGAYILYSLLFVLFCGLLIYDFRSLQKANVDKSERQPQHMPFEKGKNRPQPVKDYYDPTLFVGTIERTNKTTVQTDVFTNLVENDNEANYQGNISRFDIAQPTNSFDQNQYNQNENKEEDWRKTAFDNLYGNSDDLYKNYIDNVKQNMNFSGMTGHSEKTNHDDDGFFGRPQPFMTAPSITGQPLNKNKSEYETKSIIPDIPIISHKDLSDQIVDGPIINGDELSQSIKKSRIQDSAKEAEENNVDDTAVAPEEDEILDLPPIIVGNPRQKKVEVVETENKVQEEPEIEQLPILNGDYFVKAKAENDKNKNISNENNDDISDDENASDDEDIQQNNIIIDADLFGTEGYEDLSKFQEKAVNNEKSETAFEQHVEEKYIDANDTSDASEISHESEVKAIDDSENLSSFAQAYTQDNFDSDEVSEGEEPEIVINIGNIEENDVIEDESQSEDIDNNIDNVEAKTDNADNNFTDNNEPTFIDDNNDADRVDDNGVIHDEEKSVSDDDTNISDNNIDKEERQVNFADDETNETVYEAKIPDSLKYIKDEIDMSETREEIDNDNTGYYTSQFNNNVSEISLKLNDEKFAANKSKGLNSQINMDDYNVEVKENKPKKVKKNIIYNPPPLDLLVTESINSDDGEDYNEKANNLVEDLHNLKVDASVVKITKGPAVVRYELEVARGQSVKSIANKAVDIAYSLAASAQIRIEAPIPGKRAVGVEVPKKEISVVALKDVIGSPDFIQAKSCLTIALGKDISNQIMLCNLEKMPHLLVAGATGSGKSVCLNSIITSFMYKASPEDLRMILIDPKLVEFAPYRDMPHLLIKNIINDSTQAINAFKWARDEMDRRYAVFAQYGVRNLSDFNECPAVVSGAEVKLPRIVIIVDELAELMIAKNARELEQHIMSMAQKARAAGMHLILATQRPSVDVLTGTIKANFTSRIAFAVKSQADSRTILDFAGAETLLGKGDMLYAPLGQKEQRVQGALITDAEVASVVQYVKDHNEVDYDEEVEKIIMKKPEDAAMQNTDEEKTVETVEDPLMKEVLKKIIESKSASASQIQRKFSVGYNRAARLIDLMEDKGYIGPLDGGKPREVYITREKFIEIYGEDIS